MIVDVHTHFMNIEADWDKQVYFDLDRCKMDLSHWKTSAENHLKETEVANAAIVFGLRACKTGWNVPNDPVAEYVAKHPERLIFFTSIDPTRKSFMEELEHDHQNLHAQGVKLGPIYQGVHPLDKRYYEIYRYCERHSLPILTHMATTFSSGVPLEYARPVHMDQVAVDFPDLKIVLAHMGHPWEGETIAAIRHSPNMYADVAALYYRPWQFYNTMRLLVEYHAEDKVLFGSDYPATTTSDSLKGIRNVNAVLGNSGLPPIPSEVIEGIINKDSLKLLNLKISK